MRRKRLELKTLQESTNIDLSPRECQILNQLTNGVCNEVLANSLGVTVSTVEKHLTNIYKKLGVTSRTQAILWWMGKGGVFRN